MGAEPCAGPLSLCHVRQRPCLLSTYTQWRSTAAHTARSGADASSGSREVAVVNRMRAIRRPGESYSQVMLRLVELGTAL